MQTVVFLIFAITVIQSCVAVPISQRSKGGDESIPLTRADAKKAGKTDKEWDNPDEEWAAARENNGGDRDIEKWSGKGAGDRIITYPGTNLHDDLRSGSQYAQFMTNGHNNMRKLCSSQNTNLEWDEKLAKLASDYAKLLVKENNCEMSHTFDKHGELLDVILEGAGENIGKGQKDKFFSGLQALIGWGSEGFGNDRAEKVTGHYTALMWKSGNKVGCGYSIAADKKCTITVCNYLSTGAKHNSPPNMKWPINTFFNSEKIPGPHFLPVREPLEVKCTRPVIINEKLGASFAPKDLPLTKAVAMKRGFEEKQWENPDEEWAAAREDNGGNKDIKSWPGKGIEDRMITFPGTTNHVDIRSNSKYAQYMTLAHNAMRHRCNGDYKRIAWNEALAKYASDYAKLLVKDLKCAMSHTHDGHGAFLAKNKLGENIASSFGVLHGKIDSGRGGLNGWGQEGWKQDKTGEVTGHYTAMMWKGNTEVGCGWAYDEQKQCSITVCNYISPEITTNSAIDEENVKCTRPINVDESGFKAYYTDIKIDRPGVRHKKNVENVMKDMMSNNDNVEQTISVGTAGIEKAHYTGKLPPNYRVAMDRNYTWDEWNDPNERWAKVREDLGGDYKHIETWPGSGNKTRLITYPGTTNEDIKSGSTYARNMLTYHNNMRNLCHKTKTRTMGWNEELAKYASDYAKLLAKESKNNKGEYCEMSHTFKGHDPYKDFGAGENIGQCRNCPGISKDKASRMGVNGWGGEGFDIGWRKHKTGKVTGHYTAMMWKENRELGCGMGINVEQGCQVTVCNYRSTPQTNGGNMEKEVPCTHPINIDPEEGGGTHPFYTDAYYGTTETDYDPSSEYAVTFLDYHNIMRNMCSPGSHTMSWNKEIAEYATDYAKKLARKNKCKLSHTFEGHDSYKDIDAGENLAAGGIAGPMDKSMLGKSAPGKVLEACARQGVDGWGGEGWDKDKTGGVTGHYTAMNWFNNYEVGCGTGINIELGCSVTCCNYRSEKYKTNGGNMDEMVKCTRPINLKPNKIEPYFGNGGGKEIEEKEPKFGGSGGKPGVADKKIKGKKLNEPDPMTGREHEREEEPVEDESGPEGKEGGAKGAKKLLRRR